MRRQIAQTCEWVAIAEVRMIVLSSSAGLLAALRQSLPEARGAQARGESRRLPSDPVGTAGRDRPDKGETTPS